ncbi:MAG: MBOAT family O-acyltransferase [Oscillospiraceae bacterium]|jgi:alginate O-acetyltransferase complex protein AlgI
MSIVSYKFIIFLALLCAAYYSVPKRAQWIVLLAASLVFYLSYGVKPLLYLLFTALTTFAAGVLMGGIDSRFASYLESNSSPSRDERKSAKKAARTRKRWVLAAAVLCNMGMLAAVKFAGQLGPVLGRLLGGPGYGGEGLFSWLILTLGVSFYVFQTVGYVTDVYRGTSEPCRSFPRYLLFVCFFLQLLQGPISRYRQLYPQLVEPRDFSARNLKFGIQLMMWGYFKKVVVADRLAVLADAVFDRYAEFGGAVIFLGVMLYCIQLYGDFSGGIDIIRGAARMLGIEMVENFRRPYFSRSTAEFWRRWHISLGAWMRDYLFYPLSRTKTAIRLSRACRKRLGGHFGDVLVPAGATFIVFIVIGIWHGAGLNWLVYGIWNGALISVSMLMDAPLKRFYKSAGIIPENPLFRFFQICRTFVLVTIGRYFSRAESLDVAVAMLMRSFTTVLPRQLLDGTLLNMGLSLYNIIVALAGCVVMLVVSIIQERGYSIRESLERKSPKVQFAVNFISLLALTLFGIYAQGYVPAEFVYANI